MILQNLKMLKFKIYYGINELIFREIEEFDDLEDALNYAYFEAIENFYENIPKWFPLYDDILKDVIFRQNIQNKILPEDEWPTLEELSFIAEDKYQNLIDEIIKYDAKPYN